MCSELKLFRFLLALGFKVSTKFVRQKVKRKFFDKEKRKKFDARRRKRKFCAVVKKCQGSRDSAKLHKKDEKSGKKERKKVVCIKSFRIINFSHTMTAESHDTAGFVSQSK